MRLLRLTCHFLREAFHLPQQLHCKYIHPISIFFRSSYSHFAATQSLPELAFRINHDIQPLLVGKVCSHLNNGGPDGGLSRGAEFHDNRYANPVWATTSKIGVYWVASSQLIMRQNYERYLPCSS